MEKVGEVKSRNELKISQREGEEASGKISISFQGSRILMSLERHEFINKKFLSQHDAWSYKPTYFFITTTTYANHIPTHDGRSQC